MTLHLTKFRYTEPTEVVVPKRPWTRRETFDVLTILLGCACLLTATSVLQFVCWTLTSILWFHSFHLNLKRLDLEWDTKVRFREALRPKGCKVD